MDTLFIRRGVIFVAAVVLSVTAFAGHPLITEDSGTEGKGAHLVELNSEYSTISDGRFSSRIVGVCATLTTGVNDHLDLLVDLPFESCTVFSPNVHTSTAGLETPVIGAKWRFLDASPRLSFAIKSVLSLPYFGQNIQENSFYEMYVIGSFHGNRYGIHANTGYANAPGINEQLWHASIAGEFGVNEKLTAVTNISLDIPGTENSITTFVGGVIYSITDYFALDFGVQTTIWNSQKDLTFMTGSALNF